MALNSTSNAFVATAVDQLVGVHCRRVEAITAKTRTIDRLERGVGVRLSPVEQPSQPPIAIARRAVGIPRESRIASIQ